MENIDNSYIYTGICDDQQQYIAILEGDMMYTTDGTTEISLMSINTTELEKIYCKKIKYPCVGFTLWIVYWTNCHYKILHSCGAK